MVIVSPLSRVGALPNGIFMAYKWGVITNSLLSGVILQGEDVFLLGFAWLGHGGWKKVH